jgi:tRNA (Thr-GGU) A37 N-methylase
MVGEFEFRNLEALDGTPIVDVKPALNRTGAT